MKISFFYGRNKWKKIHYKKYSLWRNRLAVFQADCQGIFCPELRSKGTRPILTIPCKGMTLPSSRDHYFGIWNRLIASCLRNPFCIEQIQVLNGRLSRRCSFCVQVPRQHTMHDHRHILLRVHNNGSHAGLQQKQQQVRCYGKFLSSHLAALARWLQCS